MREPFRVVIVDLLCVSPYYDLELIRGLRSIGVDAKLAATSFHLDPDYFTRSAIPTLDRISDRVSRFRIRRVSVRRFCKIAEYLINLILLHRYLSKAESTIAHIQWLPLLDWVDIELLWIRRLRARGIPVVLTVHNVLPHETGTNRRRSFTKLYQSVDRLICHTQAAARELVDEFGVSAGAISVIPHGPVLTDEGEPSRGRVDEVVEASEQEVKVLFLGTLKPYKGLDILISAWQRTLSKRLNARLTVAGNGSAQAKDELKRRVDALGDDSRIDLFLGPLKTSDLVSLHEDADIVVFPYRAITQSGALMTAMAFEKAFIATDLPAFRECLGSAARPRLVPANDVDALAFALEELISKPGLRSEIRQAVRKAIDGELSWTSIGAMTRSSYRSLGELAG